MRVLFAGTPSFALPSLEKLASCFDVVGVLTNPDAPAGRGRQLKPSPVKQKALELGLRVLTPFRLDADARTEVSALKPDVLAVVAYGKIFGPKFLSLFPMGGVNVHPSLLPLYRGPAPIPFAILNRDSETGITVQKLALKMDSGDIILQEKRKLDFTETTAELTEWASFRGAELLADALRLMEDGKAKSVAQDESKATYCRLLSKEDGLIDWNESSLMIDAMVRAFIPWPRAYTFLDKEELQILEARPLPEEDTDYEPGTIVGMDRKQGILVQTGKGLLSLLKLQRRAKKPLVYKDFINGMPDLTGKKLGGPDETNNR
ncbi:methionyl-tRNA formyltransferase [Spirochaetia bacterium 38H-sp]|uniref:Methionyl-tRNA formyltransferase n=1 Tax=Rarispira pelagica TaxID=3141764 RepID=A0ABU9U9R3_9SPIR